MPCGFPLTSSLLLEYDVIKLVQHRVSKYLFKFSCIKQQCEWTVTCYFFLSSEEFELVEVEIVRLHCIIDPLVSFINVGKSTGNQVGQQAVVVAAA